MSRKTIVESITGTSTPHALIIGGRAIGSKLAIRLLEKGCVVKEEDHSYSATAGRYDYIFQFGDFPSCASHVRTNLTPGGKFLFIETDEEEIEPFQHVRILQVGEVSAWDEGKLVDTILRTMFSGHASVVVTMRKGKPKKSEGKAATDIPVITQLNDTTPFIPQGKSTAPTHLTHPAKVKQSPGAKKRRIPLGWKGVLLLIIFLLFLAGSALAGWYVLKVQRVYASFQTHVASSDWKEVVLDIRNTQDLLSRGNMVYQWTRVPLFFLDSWEPYKNVGLLLESADTLLSATQDSIHTSVSLSREGSSGFGSISATNLAILKEKYTRLAQTLTNAEKNVDRVDLPGFPKEDLLSLLSSSSEKVYAALSILPVVEKVFLPSQTQTFLLLFQNNMELRPTGGFIGSYALVIVKNGQVSNFSIEDVYTADGQLKGHVDPPDPIRKYLEQPHYFLRDSNFDPDFAVSAARASWFLQKEIGVRVDGVIAINASFLQKLLAETGGIKLADFGGEEVTSDNFYLKAYNLVQNNFFPGSTQKKDFLTAVATALRFRIEKDPSLVLTLLPVLRKSLEEKTIQLFSYDENLQKFIESQGYGGRMAQIQCLTLPSQQSTGDMKSCLPDYLALVEANLGVNKANYFITKSVVVEKRIGIDGTIHTDVTITWENTNIPEVYTSSTYVNYLRIFLPRGVSADSISLNTSPLEKQGLDVENYGNDKISLGLLVKIAPLNKAILKLSYTLPTLLDEKIDSYQFFFQKQSGDKLSPLVFALYYPDGRNLTAENFPSTAGKKNEIFYTTDTSVDRIFALKVK